MRTVGVVTALVLAHENVSPWQVLWWVLSAAVVVAGLVVAARHVRVWTQTRVWPRSTVTLVLIAAGVGLYVWGLVAGYASGPLVG